MGKSSLINRLVGVHKLARTSRTPGRTRLLNWFLVESPRGTRLGFVDLPGYGYAKVSRGLRESWQPMVEQYLCGRAKVLRGVVALIDARRGAQSEERDLLAWLAEVDIRTVVVLTKIDKLPKAKRKPAGFALQRDLDLVRPPILFSASPGAGHSAGSEALWRAIASLTG